MNHKEYLNSVKDKMLSIISDIEQKNLPPIEGIRSLLGLRHELNLSNDPVFLPLVGIDSETMDYPVGQRRENYNSETLIRLDTELAQILQEEEVNIKNALFEIRKRLQLFNL